MYKVLLMCLLASFSFSSLAIVTRHDVPKESYIAKQAPEYLINMPGEGHGVLFDEQWIVTVAHLIFGDYQGRDIQIQGKTFTIESVFIHPNAKQADSSLYSGDAKPLMDFMKTTSDIALIKLTTPVTHVKPLALYTQKDEVGQFITAFGRGSTGNGVDGSIYETKRAKILRTMTNKIDLVDGNWISISLDQGKNATALEGIDGSGDSGGPLVITKNGKQYLAGMFSWDYVEGDLKSFKHGLYGGKSYQVRISSYIDWINTTLAKHK
ncbi:trypsin-like serine protease (plasmid) [Pseudoalteromonas sp. T1lg65]|uniref:trypsin-like serine protease n=1 Tax=Pseudoalteromonas sp. T1lg65 TaxID=2077101 RepID=UPI003F7A800C